MAKNTKQFEGKNILVIVVIGVLLILLTYFAGKTQFYKASADFTTQTLTGTLNTSIEANCANQNQVKLAPYVIRTDSSSSTCIGVYATSSVADPVLGLKVMATGYYGNIRKFLDLGTTSYKGGYYFYAVSIVSYPKTSPTPYPVPTIYPSRTPISFPTPFSTPSSCVCPGTYDIPCPNSLQIYCPQILY